jgi:His/Glu/Gln/Arg/opine family amino acid ABC transporter permease subunit
MTTFEYDLLLKAFPLLASAVVETIEISVFAIVVGGLLGTGLGLVQVAGSPVLKLAVRGYVYFMRGVPLLVIIFLVYFGLPRLGLGLSAFTSGVIALGLNSAAFMAEIVRAGLESIDVGQSEAATSIGLSERQTALLILFPQSLRRIVPPTTNEFIQLVKGSSLLSTIGVYELTRSGQSIIATTFAPFEIYIGIALFYLVLVGALSVVSEYLERVTLRRV